MRLIQAGGIRLAYRESGPASAPPLVLLHSLGENSADWDQVAAALAGFCHVYALDLRGHGQSDWPGTYTLELLRDDVLAFLDALELPRVTVIGHSMGGAAAYLVAMRQPERVGRLVLEEPAPPWPRVPRSPVRPPGPLSFDWAVTVLSAEASAPPASSRDGLAAITAPTLVIAGAEDPATPPWHGAVIASAIPGARLAVVRGAAHLASVSAPGQVCCGVLGFLLG